MEKSRVLQEALHVLAQEHHQLEKSVGAQGSPSTAAILEAAADEDNEDEFYDCDEEEGM